MSEVVGEPRELTVEELLKLYVNDRTMMITFDGHCTRWRAMIRGLRKIHDALSFSYWSPECDKTGSSSGWEPLDITGEVIHISDIEKLQIYQDGTITFRNRKEFDRQYKIQPLVIWPVSLLPTTETATGGCLVRATLGLAVGVIIVAAIAFICH